MSGSVHDRIQAALDQGMDPFADDVLRAELARNPGAAADARALGRIDAELRGLGEAAGRSEASRRAFVSRLLRRLDAGPGALAGDIAGDLAAPAFDDEDALGGPGGGPSPRTASDDRGRLAPAGAGEFSLERLGQLETQPSAPPERQRRRPRPPPGDDRVEIPKIARVLPPPPELTLEPPTIETPASEAPSSGGSGRWALLAAAVAALAILGGGAAYVMGVFGGGDASEPLAQADPTAPTGDAEPDGEASADADDGLDGSSEAGDPEASGAAGEASAGDEGHDPADGQPEGADADDGAGDATGEATADAAGADQDDDDGEAARRRSRSGESRAARRSRSRERDGSGSRRSGSGGSGGSAAAASGPLPDKPSRNDVLQALQSVQPAIRGCRESRGGVAQVRITVASSGRVRNAVVQGVFAGTPEGSCVARTVRRARFPRFSDPSFTVTYPFRL
ncbi:MAG TPA: hypothetical protein RMF84_00930 [Polyangiaceae bacterium LLY-WYZ-14_1]|nr:hypothetical protein [Polyangiaceae bacterium LLY-WYZ-14_1]